MRITNDFDEKTNKEILDNENQLVLNSINSSEDENELSFSDVTETSAIGIIDLVNSTKIVANIPSSKIGKYYSIFLNTMSDIIKKHNGVVIKNIGDSLLYYFPESNKEEKTCFKNILQCSLTMIASRGMINQKLRLEKLPEIDFRISNDYGTVITAKSSNNKTVDIFGNTVNVCAKMNALTPANNLIIGGDLYRSVKNLNEYIFEEYEGLTIGVKHAYSTYLVKINNEYVGKEINTVIHQTLLDVGTSDLDYVRKKLFSEYRYFITDCHENPAPLYHVLADAFGKDGAVRVLDKIKLGLQKLSHNDRVSSFLTEIERIKETQHT